jgi:hypothetical protein
MNNILQQFAAAKLDAPKVGIPEVSADSVITDVLSFVYFFAGIVCIIVIIIAGIMYSTSNGDSNKITSAKNAILYALVGLVIIMMAFTITGFILGRF